MKNRYKFFNRCFGGLILVFKDIIVKYIKVLEIDCKFIFLFKLSKILLNISEDVVCGLVYILFEGSRYFFLDCFLEIE